LIDLSLSDEQEAVSSVARQIALDVLDPVARDAEKGRKVPGAVWQTIFDSGLAHPVPEEYGGGGVPDAVTQCVAAESLAYGDPGIALAALWSGAAGLVVAMCGSAEQQQQVLPRLATEPDARGAVALYEGFGRAPSESRTTFTPAGDTWKLDGEKIAVAAASDADPLIVIGVEAGTERLVAAIVDIAATGVTISPDERHIALDAAPTFTLTFEGVTVPDANVLASDHAGGVEAAVSRVRLLLAAANVGCAQRALEYASQYALDRVAFGKPIAAFQGVSFLLADASMRIQAARLSMYHAATFADGGLPSEVAVSNAVNYAGVAATQSTRDSLQVLGGHGFITDHPVELWYRSAAAISAIDFDPLLSAFDPAL
jgi:alkylation response protein AidB-like acyl-CoA dehydrogenase